MRQFFEFLKILNKKAYFLVSLFVKLVIISDLTIRIRSTVLKNGVFEESSLFIFKNLNGKTGNGFIKVECFAF